MTRKDDLQRKKNHLITSWFLYTANPQQVNLRFSGPPSGQVVGGGARTRDRRVLADLRADSLATVPPKPLKAHGNKGRGRQANAHFIPKSNKWAK
ncbi:hypothetical protein PoB_003650900 [Plakobranchus ocellatus]|uniref:Uncharacterized protein n=1 Tax=Plakobranchus ocellatus TaxID=259542 RepID=A0AAV4AV75_9GAST|nr:hypothetical protein PoB_003650900 [Plakobranchus ocellatus]